MGVVQPGERRRALSDNLRQQLLAFRDPADGARGGGNCSCDQSDGGNASVAPDLIVGYGTRLSGSWQTGLGGTPAALIEDNTDAWIGDHCINAADVPGVLFSSRPVRAANPGLRDETAEVPRLFGLKP